MQFCILIDPSHNTDAKVLISKRIKYRRQFLIWPKKNITLPSLAQKILNFPIWIKTDFSLLIWPFIQLFYILLSKIHSETCEMTILPS